MRYGVTAYRQSSLRYGVISRNPEGETGRRQGAKIVYSFIRFRHCGQVWVYSFRMTVVNGGVSMKRIDAMGVAVFGARYSAFGIRYTENRVGVKEFPPRRTGIRY